MKVVIHTDKLSKHYGKNGEIKAVDDLDLGVYGGETIHNQEFTDWPQS